MRIKYTLSQHLSHFFHVVSNVKPVVWIGLYVCMAPIFALIYWALPDGQFRIPEGETTNYGSWLYYSIVTISTLGFGDFTPAHGAAQAVTAIEVMCGLIFLGFFLNSVGAMKSEIDVESEIEKQKAIHHAIESNKLLKSVPVVIDTLNKFLAYCYAVTTPEAKRGIKDVKYDPEFSFNDLYALFEPTNLPFDRTNLPGVERLMNCSSQASLALDSLQQRIDLSLWPRLLELCFSFVANYQMFANIDIMFRNPEKIVLINDRNEESENNVDVEKLLSEKIKNWKPEDGFNVDANMRSIEELYNFIKENGSIAMRIETELAKLAMEDYEYNETNPSLAT